MFVLTGMGCFFYIFYQEVIVTTQVIKGVIIPTGCVNGKQLKYVIHIQRKYDELPDAD